MRARIEARQRAMEELLTSGATRRTITVDELLQRIIIPTVGHEDRALAEALARLLNGDDEAGVWVAEVDESC